MLLCKTFKKFRIVFKSLILFLVQAVYSKHKFNIYKTLKTFQIRGKSIKKKSQSIFSIPAVFTALFLRSVSSSSSAK